MLRERSNILRRQAGAGDLVAHGDPIVAEVVLARDVARAEDGQRREGLLHQIQKSAEQASALARSKLLMVLENALGGGGWRRAQQVP